MKDQQFLVWLHQRLVLVHGENGYEDFMHKFRAIIRATKPHVETPILSTSKDIKDLIDLYDPDLSEYNFADEEIRNKFETWYNVNFSDKLVWKKNKEELYQAFVAGYLMDLDEMIEEC